MPKINRKYQGGMPPQIDWLWAAYLERRKVYGYDLKQMADIAGVSYERMRQMESMSPWSWTRKSRDRVCSHFGINLNFQPTLNDTVEVRIS